MKKKMRVIAVLITGFLIAPLAFATDARVGEKKSIDDLGTGAISCNHESGRKTKQEILEAGSSRSETGKARGRSAN